MAAKTVLRTHTPTVLSWDTLSEAVGHHIVSGRADGRRGLEEGSGEERRAGPPTWSNSTVVICTRRGLEDQVVGGGSLSTVLPSNQEAMSRLLWTVRVNCSYTMSTKRTLLTRWCR